MISDRDHGDLVQHLLSLLSTNPDLIACILDTVSNLCLPPNSKSMKKILEAAQTLLGTAEPPMLPVITR
jgi:hypothetical protein